MTDRRSDRFEEGHHPMAHDSDAAKHLLAEIEQLLDDAARTPQLLQEQLARALHEARCECDLEEVGCTGPSRGDHVMARAAIAWFTENGFVLQSALPEWGIQRRTLVGGPWDGHVEPMTQIEAAHEMAVAEENARRGFPSRQLGTRMMGRRATGWAPVDGRPAP